MKNWKNWAVFQKIRMWLCAHRMWGVKVEGDYLNYTCLQCGLTKQQKRP